MTERAHRMLSGCHRGIIGLLGLLLGMLLAVGITAATAFPVMKTLDPHLPQYLSQVDGHWAIAAGKVMNPVFSTVASIGIFLVILATILCGNCARLLRGSAVNRVFLLASALLMSALLLTHCLFAIKVRGMQEPVQKYWLASAVANNDVRANELRASFDSMHRTASTLLKVETAIAGVTLILFCVAAPLRRTEHPS